MWFSNDKDKENKYYKVKNINTFAWDRARSNKKKYRSVFDRNEINYLSVGLELYNKKFDEEDWKTQISFKAFTLENGKKTKEHCSETKEYSINKDENIVQFEYGWGNAAYGKYWQEGVYRWEITIGDEMVGTTDFYIEDIGKVSLGNNPYFEVVSFNTYESGLKNTDRDQRVYLKEFDKETARYIMAELTFNSKVPKEWLCELFFNYYDDSGMLIGSIPSTTTVEKKVNEDSLTIITTGWGSDTGKVWLEDNYRIEAVFMETVVAMIPFKVGNKNRQRLSKKEALMNQEIGKFYQSGKFESKKIDTTDTEQSAQIKTPEEPKKRPLKEILAELDELIGLEEIKRKIKEYIDYITYLKIRKEKGIEDEEEINLHSVFTGNPGTGKTTVVKLLGEIYHAMGILSKGHVLTVESNDLIAGYVRQTGENTKKVIEKARGGILFIDEAYMLYKEDSPNDFGPEAIAALITEMSDGPGDIAIMVAGYPEEMNKFIHSNPGLKSRFRNYYHFEDFTPNQLVDIARYAAKHKDVILEKKALEKIKKIVTNAYRKRDKTFGNARLVHAIIDEAKMNLGIRLVREYEPEKITKKLLRTIKAEDIEDLTGTALKKRLKLDIDNALLEEATAELNSLTGLHQIKQEVQELIRLTKYYRENDRDILKAFSLHSVFLGNPGTGKTTVARIIGRVYKALGLLERGHLIEADGGDLIAGYVGQTSLKTKELIKDAMGGILFIDEAYAITETSGGSGNDFGKKAIAALIKEMEDHRGEFGLIVAGYTDNMKRFLETNPGMKSRFDRTFLFPDFTEEELWEIARNMLAKKGLKPDAKATAHIKKYIAHLYKNRSKFFGNARSMRKMVEKAYRNQELRMAALDKNNRTQKMMATLSLEDVLEFKETSPELSQRKTIGFK